MSFVIKKPEIVNDDVLAAAAWYDEQEPGLGDDFLDEVDLTVSSLRRNALIHAIRFSDVRCVRLKRFKKYGVFYRIVGNEVHLLAIHHGSRDPGFLAKRRSALD